MRWVALIVLTLGCASAPPPKPAPKPKAPPPASTSASAPVSAPASVSVPESGSVSVPASVSGSVSQPSPAPSEADPLPGVRVKGLEGTLNKDDVHQTMDARMPAFDVCIKEVRRRHRWVSGTIRFDFAVDGAGKVEQVLPADSDIGHVELERCLTRVVAETQFPKPAGRSRARFSWDMRVDGVRGGATELLEADVIDKILRKRASDVYQDCKVRRRGHRFEVTVYVGKTGKVLSVGAVPTRVVEDEQLDCVLGAVASWRLPKQKRRAKVSFLLR